jgi:hypothetical protein
MSFGCALNRNDGGEQPKLLEFAGRQTQTELPPTAQNTADARTFKNSVKIICQQESSMNL